uniref:Transposase n=1 Tax=Vespula pensylvanica TaxID=30213 RepID=A0A834JUA3_VESPE|nr:hypothetical protein H0235_017087 [Vespula pensylvanica]
MFIWSYEIGNLAPIYGIMTADKYGDTLNENLEESILKIYFDERWMLQQDNDLRCTVKKTNKFLQDCEIEILEWPTQSADLNLTENL